MCISEKELGEYEVKLKNKIKVACNKSKKDFIINLEDDFLQKKKLNLVELINDPFHGKGGFMPAKIKDKIKIRIGLNENLAFPEDVMKKLVREAAEKIDPRIYPEDYCDSLCELIATEHSLNSNQVVVANGGDKIIDLMVRLTLKAGYSGIVLQPTYPMYEHAIKVQGADMKELFLTPPPDYDLNPDYILENIAPKKDRLLFLCSPNNPSGNQFDEKKLRQIISEFPGIVALDETYANFGRYSLIPVLKDYPNLIIMRSMSKLFGLAGIRVGYALADEFLISRIQELLPAFNVNAFSIELAKLVMKQKDLLKKLITDITTERDFLYNELLKINDIIPYKSFTNFILFRFKKGKAAEIQQRILKEKGILLRNMSSMPMCENCLRVSVTTRENDLIFLKALKEMLKEKY